MHSLNKIILYSTLIISCSKEIPLNDVNFGNGELPYEIAVDGFISNEFERCRLVLSKPLSVEDEIVKTPIVNAEIILKDENNIFVFEHNEEGVYFTIDSIIAHVGKSYILEINYNNNKYTAITVMPAEPNDDFYIPFFYTPSYDGNGKPQPYDSSSVSYNVYVHNFGYEKTNIWALNEVSFNNNTTPDYDTYITFTFPIYTHKGSLLQGVLPPSTGLTGIYGAESDTIEILKAEISADYNKYLLDKFNETDWQAGMFSTIPGNVSTNLSEGGIGYFYALNIKRKRFTIGDFVDHE